MGICGKSPETTVLQDLLVFQIKGISQYAHRARQLGEVDAEVNYQTLKCLFVTLTNVNFDDNEHYRLIKLLGKTTLRARHLYEEACQKQSLRPVQLQGAAAWQPPDNNAEIAEYAMTISLLKKLQGGDKDIIGLQELLTYGIKGLAAYAHHAEVLGYRDGAICAFVHEAMDYLTEPEQRAEDLLAYCLKAGQVNLRVMELLDQAHTETFGHPQPTAARTTYVPGKCILVSGHDMKALHELLKQTEGTGINVYTHGELLPALGYPKLKEYKHLVGNFGTAWQNQVKEFDMFPGAIVMTTNCLKPPSGEYRDRLFTIDAVGFDGIAKVQEYDYSQAIKIALDSPGFTSEQEPHYINVGFGHDAVLGVADKVIEGVKSGAIRHFFLVGGCDGAEFARNYYTDLAEKMPTDCLILTLGCAKYRFNMQEFGQIGDLPRLLDLGQCNDSYSAIKIAGALASAFDCTVNDLPLSIVLSWLEQKAVAVLLTLLHLGIKDIRLGPSLPAFVTPTVLAQLTEAYGLRPIDTPERDLAVILGK